MGREAYVRNRKGASRPPVPRELVWLTAFLALMPYVASVGTNSPFTEAMPHYAVFWLMATLVGLRSWGGAESLRVVVVGVALGVTGVMVATALLDGGPSASLLAADVRVPVAGGTLGLPPAEAQVAASLNEVARREGLTPDTPVVDLTGVSPGYAFQLGGRPLGRESFMGIFPGAPEAAALCAEPGPLCGPGEGVGPLGSRQPVGRGRQGRPRPADPRRLRRGGPVQPRPGSGRLATPGRGGATAARRSVELLPDLTMGCC